MDLSNWVKNVEHKVNIIGIRCACMTSDITTLRRRQRAAPAPQNARTLSEVFALSAQDAGVVAFVAAHFSGAAAPILWVQDRVSRKETGAPYLMGLGLNAIIKVDVSRAVDVLWAVEEGLRCSAIAGVIAEVWGDPPALSFTATKRLAMRAEAHKLPCWLIRRAGAPNLSAARNRWRIASLPSAAHPDDPRAPGAPRWQAELFRARSQATGTWVASYDGAADRVHFAARPTDGEVAARDGAQRLRAT